MPERETRIQAPGAASLPVNLSTLYPEGDGLFDRRTKARRAKLLGGIEVALRKALAPGETIRYVARGCRYFLGEYWFGGGAAYHHNMTALVLTDRRLLLVQIDGRGRPGDMKNQVQLAAIRGAGRSFLSGWGIRLADGTRLSFVALRAADRKRLQALLPTCEGPKAAEPSLEHLCPACLRHVPGKVGATATCPEPTCRIPFRDPEKAARLSTWVPGLGDLYLRHHLFGALEFLGSMLMLGVGLALLAEAIANPEPSSVVAAAFVLLLLVVVPRVIDRRVTRHMGGRDSSRSPSRRRRVRRRGTSHPFRAGAPFCSRPASRSPAACSRSSRRTSATTARSARRAGSPSRAASTTRSPDGRR